MSRTTSHMTDNNKRAWGMAQKAFAAVSIIEAGYCGRLAMGQPPESAEVFHLLGLVAQALGRPDVACSWFERALALAPTSSEVSKSLAAARGELPGWQSWQQEEAQRERYVLIKAWSAGFFSEVDHVMGWCLFASITGRILTLPRFDVHQPTLP